MLWAEIIEMWWGTNVSGGRKSKVSLQRPKMDGGKHEEVAL